MKSKAFIERFQIKLDKLFETCYNFRIANYGKVNFRYEKDIFIPIYFFDSYFDIML